WNLPLALELGPAPRAVPHERHHFLARAPRIAAPRRIPHVRVVAVAHFFETRSVAPRAIFPVQLAPPSASTAPRRETRRAPVRLGPEPAPGAGLHCFAEGMLAPAAVDQFAERLP